MAGTDENYQRSEDEIQQIKAFLNANGINEKKDKENDGWYELMVKRNVGTELIKVLKNKTIEKYCTGDDRDESNKRVPAYNRVLKAFTLVRPEEVKVLVIGTSPALSVGEEGGVAFSSAQPEPAPGGAVEKFRDALEKGLGRTKVELKAMKLEAESFNLEDWAKENKVLLLNAGLTMTGPWENWEKIKQNCDLWESFMKQLLNAWRESRIRSNQQPQTADGVSKVTEEIEKLTLETTTTKQQQEDNNKVYVLLLGYKSRSYENSVHYSKQVWDLPEKENTDATLVVYENVHHPTFPGQNGEVPNNFMADAPAFFKAAFPQ